MSEVIPTQDQQPTYNQLLDQYNQQGNASMLVSRSNGEVQVGNFKGEAHNGQYLVELPEKDAQGNNLLKPVHREGLSDQTQSELAERLATSREKVAAAVGADALSGAEVVVATKTEAASSPWDNEALVAKARSAADNKYNQVMQTTGDSDAAEVASSRVWKGFGF